jgi:hypothetical protein
MSYARLTRSAVAGKDFEIFLPRPPQSSEETGKMIKPMQLKELNPENSCMAPF